MKINKGYVLQDNIKKSCDKQDILFYRFKDSPFSFASSDKTKFTTNNICDCMMFLVNKLLFVELKSIKGKSFSFTEHSLRQLNDINKIIHNKNGYKRFNVYGCFIIEFRELEETYFIEVQNIIKYLEENNTKTINIKKYKEKGKYIKVDQEILRKNYRYDIRKLFIELGGNYSE
jgi:hypothetical protein